MSELNKSLALLDTAADELLKKSTAKEIEEEQIDSKLNKCDDPDGDNVKKGEDCDDEDVKKSEDTTDEDTEDDDTDDDNTEDTEEDTEKSLQDIQENLTEDFATDADLAAGIRNSEFQAALVCQLVKSLGDIQFDMGKATKASNSATSVLAKSLYSIISANNTLRTENQKLTRRITSLEKSMRKSFDEVLGALDSLGSQPVHQGKSVISVHDRDFKKSLGNDSQLELSKSEILEILSNEMFTGSNKVTASDIIGYESGAPLRPELKALVASKAAR